MNGKILFIDETANIGGAELNLILKAKGLQERGWPVMVLLTGTGPFKDLLDEHEIPVIIVSRPPLRSTSFYIFHRIKLPDPLGLAISAISGLIWGLRLYRKFRSNGPIIVHTISMMSHLFGGFAGRLAGQRVVWHFQQIVSPNSGFGIYRLIVVFLGKFIPDRILCISDRVAEQFTGGWVPREKIIVLWNAIDLEKFSPTYGKQTNHRNNVSKLKIGSVGRLTHWKGQETALRAARGLKERGVPFHWSFVGDASLGDEAYREYLLDLARRWDLSREVEFLGWVDCMTEFYHSLDVLVHVPVEPEPFGLVLAEAMASGLPVVASSGGGIDEIVERAGGILVEPCRAEQIVKTLESFSQARAALNYRGKTARQLAESVFDTKNYIDKLVALYDCLG